MSETLRVLIESLLLIGALTAALVWYAAALARRENRDARPFHTTVERHQQEKPDPDAHLGRRGVE